jgi:hypothetical protein
MASDEQLPHRKALASARKPSLGEQAIALPDDTDILDLCKSNLPTMLKRAIDSALRSDDVREIMPVLTTLVDRVHGKVGVGSGAGGGSAADGFNVTVRHVLPKPTKGADAGH